MPLDKPIELTIRMMIERFECPAPDAAGGYFQCEFSHDRKRMKTANVIVFHGDAWIKV